MSDIPPFSLKAQSFNSPDTALLIITIKLASLLASGHLSASP